MPAQLNGQSRYAISCRPYGEKFGRFSRYGNFGEQQTAFLAALWTATEMGIDALSILSFVALVLIAAAVACGA